MDTMDKYKIGESIRDVIGILDSAPIRPDLVEATNIVQLTNRVPIVHLGIERGLKALIRESGGTAENTHGLNKLYRVLIECDKGAADYLAMAFEDAVEFFGYNVKAKGYTQLRSINDYLSKVGTEKAFDKLRYWAIGESSKGDSPIRHILPRLHREILCALHCLFLPDRRETVSGRVESEVALAMFEHRNMWFTTDDTNREESVQWYANWLLCEHATRRRAIEEAVQQEFRIKPDDEFIRQTLEDAYKELCESDDPAVRYYIGTLTHLPGGSQTRNPDAVPRVEWSNHDQTKGTVVTPSGTDLGFIDKNADRTWAIMPLEQGEGRVTDVASSLADAKHYLVNRRTAQVTVTVNGNSTQLRIVGEPRVNSKPSWNIDREKLESISDLERTYNVEFWDAEHGICSGDAISVEIPTKVNQDYFFLFQGKVRELKGHLVSITATRIACPKPRHNPAPGRDRP